MDIPIIFITGAGSVANSVTALKAGAADFIQKPVLGDTLIAAIENALIVEQRGRPRIGHQSSNGGTSSREHHGKNAFTIHP